MFKNTTKAVALCVVAMGSAASANCTVSVPFASGSAALSSQTVAYLNRLAQTHGSNAMQLTGHTDAVGSAATNARLSNARVQAVMSALRNGGVQPGAINSSTALASSAPKVAGSGAQAANRRVEIRVADCVPSQFAGSAGVTTQVVQGGAVGGLGGAAGTGSLIGLGAIVVAAGVSASSGT